jgi:uncharacterized protein
MSEQVLSAIAEKILRRISRDAQPTIVWHAGEPTTLPVDWYDTAYQILKSAAPTGSNWAMQTNGIGLTSKWIDFFFGTQTNVSLSIDGPREFHDSRRKTKKGAPTWHLVMRSLAQLQEASINPGVISVISKSAVSHGDDYYRFYRDNHLTSVSISIDELEAANQHSSFGQEGDKPGMTNFLMTLLRRAMAEQFPLSIREVERIAGIMYGTVPLRNEQVRPWDIILVTKRGDVSTFSPEGVEVQDRRYNNFVFGNLLSGDLEDFRNSPYFQRAYSDILTGIEVCRRSCEYFNICGGGAPVNKLSEFRSLSAGETSFCRTSIQSAADALLELMKRQQRVSR